MNLKIAILLILVSGANILGAVSYSQSETVTLNMEKATLQQVMDEIERQSNLFFIFNQKQIDVDRMVDVPKDHTLINEVLPDLLVDTDIKYAIVDNKILLTTDPRRENILTSVSVDEPLQINITGTITDASTSEPMPGVNIHVSGTTVGTISDINGNYSLSVPNLNAVLVFSFVGYESQEIAVAGRSVVNVSLSSEVKGLEEVVVIGYGTQKKETLTGSVAQIKADEIQATKTTSVASAIHGKIVGVQIRQQSAEPGVYSNLISVRGFGAPLLVIDGVVRDGMEDFEKLNPNDIETMSVLKDASAAIYGMNADNGVIIITTRRGATDGKITWTYSGMHSSKQPTTTKRQSNVDAYTLRVLNNEMLKQTKMPLATSESELEKWKAGTEPGYRDFNWIEEAIRDWTHSQQHNLSVQGGNNNLSFFSSFGYMRDNGLFMDLSLQGYDKYNFRTNIDATLAKGLTSRISFSGRWEDRITPPGTYFWIFKEAIVGDRGVEPFTLANNGHYSLVPADNRNAFASMNRDVVGYIQDKTLQYQTTIDLNYKLPFVKGLSVGVLLGYDGSLANYRRFNKSYTMYDFKTDAAGPASLADYQETLTHFTRMNAQTKIGYQTSIGQAHNISATLVNDVRHFQTNHLGGKRQYDDVFTHDVLDQASLTNQQTEGYRNMETFVSYLGRFNYDYRNKYLVEVSFRQDGSYRYAPSKRWAFFPAFSLGWRVGQENFIKNNLPFVTDLKIRASWGKMGRDVGNAFEYYEGYQFTDVDGGYVFNDGVLTMGMISPGVVNDNLTWVSTTTTNLGLDLDLFRGKFGLVFDIFKKLSEGELATRISAVPNTFGATFPQENLNGSEIKGVELMISHRNTVGKFDYSVNANVTYSRRYLLHVEQAPYRSTMQQWQSGSDGDGRIQGREWVYEEKGQYTSVVDFETAPLRGGANGNSYGLPGMYKLLDLNEDGVIDRTDRLPNSWAGTYTNPPLQYGANFSGSYKNFDMTLGFQGSALFTVWVSRYDNWGYGTRFPVVWTWYLDRWRMEDPDDDPFDPATKWIPGKWEALTANPFQNQTSAATDRWRMPATYLRLKTFELGYTLPANISQKIHIQHLRPFINIFNVFTWCREDVKGLDPERNEGEYRVDLTYPLLRSFNLGMEIKF